MKPDGAVEMTVDKQRKNVRTWVGYVIFKSSIMTDDIHACVHMIFQEVKIPSL